MALIKGRIVKILTEKALIINLGAKDGLSINDVVNVVTEGEDVKDPEKGKKIEKLEYVKGVLRVSHVQDKIATCVPFSSSKNVESSLYRTVSSDMARVAMEKSPYGEEAEALNVKSADISGMPSIDAITIGDTVVAQID